MRADLAAVTLACACVALGSCLFPSLGVRSPPLSALRVVAYEARGTDGGSPWSNWNAADLERARTLGANTVRLSIDPSAFGYPRPTHAADLARAVDLASQHGLRVELTLFAGTTDPDASQAAAWTRTVLAPYAQDPRIAAVCAHPALDPTVASASDWAAAVLSAVRATMHGTPAGFTVAPGTDASALGAFAATLSDSPPDWYGADFTDSTVTTAPEAGQVLMAMRAAVAPVTVRVDAVGFPTDVDAQTRLAYFAGEPHTAAAREAFQDLHLRTVAFAAQQLGLSTTIGVHDLIDTAQSTTGSYGLFASDGTAKQPSVATVQALFAGMPVDTGFNAGFETAADDAPAGWLIGSQGSGTFVRDTSQHHGGVASARMSQVPSSTNWSAFIAAPPAGVVTSGTPHTFAVSAWVMTQGAVSSSEARIGIGFADATGHFIDLPTPNTADSALAPPSSEGNWAQLSTSYAAPASTAFVVVLLKAHGQPGSVWFDDVTLQ